MRARLTRSLDPAGLKLDTLDEYLLVPNSELAESRKRFPEQAGLEFGWAVEHWLVSELGLSLLMVCCSKHEI